uniref:Ribosomal protein S19 n=1 Tax=Gloeotilopsis planctonica TaxID=34157 RepID=A0A1B2RZ02_9CHLO|nr:ribosomal protein S19 [Gloeotilopsis planctonica]
MTRSSYKIPYTARSLKNKDNLLQQKNSFLLKSTPSLLTLANLNENKGIPPISVYQRSSTILPEMIGSTVRIHSGQKFVKLSISEHTVGYKFGEFAPSKKRALYKKKKTIKPSWACVLFSMRQRFCGKVASTK